MPAGKKGDSPYSDLQNFGSSGFGRKVDNLIREMAKWRDYHEVRAEVANILWDYWPEWGSSAKEGGVEKAYELLLEVYEMMPKRKARFWHNTGL